MVCSAYQTRCWLSHTSLGDLQNAHGIVLFCGMLQPCRMDGTWAVYAPRRRWEAALTGAATRSSLGAANTSLDSSSVRMAPSLHNQR